MYMCRYKKFGKSENIQWFILFLVTSLKKPSKQKNTFTEEFKMSSIQVF